MKTTALACMLALGLARFATAQGVNATLSGTVIDSSRAVVQGARVSAENVVTGVVTETSTNNAGVYSLPSLLPGLYRVSARSTGLRSLVYTAVTLEVGASLVLNLELQIAPRAESVEVSTQVDPALSVGNASVGTVIDQRRLQDLPGPANEALDAVLTQAGVQGNNLSGARIGTLNVTRDGINIQDQFINLGLNSPLFNSVEVIQEVRVVTSPADAELGRGSGQVQILTRPGTREYRGQVFAYHNNASLNANDWFDNSHGTPRDPEVYNEFGASLGGPIQKGKTFFQALYQGKRHRFRDTVTPITYTEPARQGLFRFFPGASNQNLNETSPVVDLYGTPVRPAFATGGLNTVTLFGRDPNRLAPDPSGIVQRMLNLMPVPNDFHYGDGLNTAGFRWNRRRTLDEDQVDVRLDHKLNAAHTASLSFVRHTHNSFNEFMPQRYPDSPGGDSTYQNYFSAFNLTSTLSPTIVNEFRAGAQRFRFHFRAPWEFDEGRALLPTAAGQPFLLNMQVSSPIDISNAPQGRISPLYTLADSLSWIRGRHNFRGGGEVRFASSNGFTSFDVMPTAMTGAVAGAPVVNIDTIPGIGTNVPDAQSLLIELSGSLSSVRQAFNASAPPNPVFLAGAQAQRTWKRREFSLFFKDDWKLRPSLTLNLGLRYEYYGVPYEVNGKASSPVGGDKGLFGITGTGWADLYQPGRTNGTTTLFEQIGPNSPNPGRKLYNTDLNNFAPAVGLSWSIPFLGRDKTVLRVGYGVGYELSALVLADTVGGSGPGLSTTATFSPGTYLNLTGVSLPLVPSTRPLEVVPYTDRLQSIGAFDANLRTPYVQNWNVSIQRSLARNLRLDVRYVGSKGTKLIRGTNVNEVNIFETGILDAFRTTQAGGNAQLFNQIFQGLDLGLGPVNGTSVTGSASLRSNSSTQVYFANNLVGAFASFLNTTASFTGERGGLLRRAGLRENFIVANPQFGQAILIGNFANSNYHALQTDLTRRFSNGLVLEGNFTWSKTIGEEEGSSQTLLDSYRSSRDRGADKRLLSFHRRYSIRGNGSYELPFGPQGRFFNGTNGVVARLLEHWQIGAIAEITAGAPFSFTSATSPFNENPDTASLVGTLPKGIVTRQRDGVSFFPNLRQVNDPAADALTTLQNLRSRSGMAAISGTSLVLVNPQLGTLGNLPFMYAQGPGRFQLDMNVLKRITLREGMALTLRVDAISALNSPLFSNPVGEINSTSFGKILSAGGARSVILGAKLSF